MLVLSFAVGIGIFFLLPLFLAQATVGRVNQGLGLQLSEGLIRVFIFVGYLLLVGRTPDVRRTFQYHGAEHMSIHTLEGGDPLTVAAASKYPTAHPRCGTEFLVVVLIVSIFAFALIGSLPPLWLVVSRVILIPVIAAISYEILQFGARRRQYALVRALWSPGIWVQMITTKQPTDDMIEVAIVSLERALARRWQRGAGRQPRSPEPADVSGRGGGHGFGGRGAGTDVRAAPDTGAAPDRGTRGPVLIDAKLIEISSQYDALQAELSTPGGFGGPGLAQTHRQGALPARAGRRSVARASRHPQGAGRSP